MRIRPVGSSTIGNRVHFVGGQFTGHTYRAELEELQKADLGRKYARKDRRPLDPPPVVLFKFIEILNADGGGVMSERVVENYDDFSSSGFLCHVDVFPIPEVESGISQPERTNGSLSPLASSSSAGHSPVSSPPVASTSSHYSPSFSAAFPPMPHSMLPSHRSSTSQIAHTLASFPQAPTPIFPPLIFPLSLPLMYSIPAPAPPPPGLQIPAPSSVAQPDVVAYAGDFAITESSKRTEELSGTTFVQASTLDYQGKKQAMFVFSDLAVRIEGTFCPRYRVFNIFSAALGEVKVPILAECYGGPFKIYSTKEFPGLRASTDLTKHISFFGVRLNLRENERKRRRRSDIDADEAERHLPAGPSSAVGRTSAVSHTFADSGVSGRRGGKGKARNTRRRTEHSSSEESDGSDGDTQ